MDKQIAENSPAFEGWDNHVDMTMSPVRDGRTFLSSPQGLGAPGLLKPSVETLGYFRGALTQDSAA